MSLIEIEYIVGIAEIAERLEWSSSTVANWAHRYKDFPRPIKVLRRGSLYSWPQIRRWAIRNKKVDGYG